jgi:hypothetical protein
MLAALFSSIEVGLTVMSGRPNTLKVPLSLFVIGLGLVVEGGVALGALDNSITWLRCICFNSDVLVVVEDVVACLNLVVSTAVVVVAIAWPFFRLQTGALDVGDDFLGGEVGMILVAKDGRTVELTGFDARADGTVCRFSWKVGVGDDRPFETVDCLGF